ncbi:MAG TPA: DUF6524 family protein [Pseudomonadales bacterium]|jgi:hypothetical protein
MLARLLGPLALVLATYNPSGASFFHWARDAMAADAVGPLHVVAVAVLAIGWAILLVATWNALDTLGVVLALFLMASLVWLFIEWGVLSPTTGDAMTWIALVCLALLLAIGLSWAHVWRRLTGQYSVDEIDD